GSSPPVDISATASRGCGGIVSMKMSPVKPVGSKVTMPLSWRYRAIPSSIASPPQRFPNLFCDVPLIARPVFIERQLKPLGTTALRMAKIRALVLDHRIRSGWSVPIGHARLQRLLIYVSKAGAHQVAIAQWHRFVGLREE